MSKTLALFLSYLIHPALMPVIGVTIILFFSPFYFQSQLFFLVVIYVFAGTYVFPLLMIFLLKRLGIITSVHLPTAQERRYPFLASILFYYLTAQSVRNFPIPSIISDYIFAGTIMLVILWAVLRFGKLSAHMAGIGGLIGLILALSFTFKLQLLVALSLLIILAGLLGTARLVLKAHTFTEIYLGFLIGFFCVVFVFAIPHVRILNDMALHSFTLCTI